MGACNLNVPLPAGCGEGAYLEALEDIVVPALEAFSPELVLVAAGYDACALDPLGRMLLRAHSYARMTARLMQVADRVCAGRLVVCHEGGYSSAYAPFCGLATIETLTRAQRLTPDPFAERYASDTYHHTRPHQAAAIDRANEPLALLLDAVAERA